MSKTPKERLFARKADAPVPYWLPHRWLDARAGRTDGRGAVLADQLGEQDQDPRRVEMAVATSSNQITLVPASGVCLTPYLGALDRRYRGQSERVRLLLDEATALLLGELLAVNRELPVAEEQVIAARKELEAMPQTAPAEYLLRRNSVERNADETLVATRNQRDWDAARQPAVGREAQSIAHRNALQKKQAELEGEVEVLRRVAATRVRRLHEHVLRRSRTYERRLVLRHPSGSALLTRLAVGRPELPEWVNRFSTERDEYLPLTVVPPVDSRGERHAHS